MAYHANASAQDIVRKALLLTRVIDGLSAEEAQERVKLSASTLTRYVRLLRGIGVDIQCVRDHPFSRYKVVDYGPFDPTKLRSALNARS